MSAGTSIEWTDATWNPTRGCSRVSEGCRNCYAERVAARFAGVYDDDLRGGTVARPRPFHGFAVEGRLPGRSAWTGKVALIPEKLAEPLRWKKPRRIFVNSMSDLFHEALPFEDIARVYATMAAAQRHTFQVLTKRPGRRLEFIHWLAAHGRAAGALRNVWEGVSVEDQATADERIPLLLQTPAARRFVSYEPALGPVDFARIKFPHGLVESAGGELPALDWIIVGGESGPGARPFDVEWARSTVRACREAGVAAFCKQLGAYVVWNGVQGGGIPSWPRETGSHDNGDGRWRKHLVDRKGGDMAEWPEDLRVREFPA